MATLQVRLQDLATRIATECKSLRTLINGNAADLSALTTTSKTNLVAALNEVKAELDSVAAASGATINDASTASTTQTYSIDKILAELSALNASVNTAIADQAIVTKDEILNGAGTAYDTLAELQALLEGDAASITDIYTQLGNRVRTDTAAQGLTTLQKSNARANIDAYGVTELGDPDTNLVTTFNTGLV